MEKIHRWLALRLVLGSAALVETSAAFAGASFGAVIEYAPAPAGQGTNAVPTLSEWGLIAMAMLVGIMAYRSLRKKMGGRPLASLILAGALGLVMVHSFDWISSALADLVPVSLDQPAGGFADVYFTTIDKVPVTNTTNVPFKVIGVEAINGKALGNPVDKCAAGLILMPGQICYVSFVIG